MDLSDFLRDCHKKVHLHSDLVLNQCDPSTVLYIRPFSLNNDVNPIVGYVYVSILNNSDHGHIKNQIVAVAQALHEKTKLTMHPV